MKNNEAADEIGRSNAAFMLRAPLEDVILGAPKLGDDRVVEQGEFIRILERVRQQRHLSSGMFRRTDEGVQ